MAEIIRGRMLWTLYPIVAMMRMVGFMEPWTEQVLVYTLLDVAAKSVTFSVMLGTILAALLNDFENTSKTVADMKQIQFEDKVARA